MGAQRRLEVEWADDVESELVAYVVDVVKYALNAARFVAQAQPLLAVVQHASAQDGRALQRTAAVVQDGAGARQI